MVRVELSYNPYLLETKIKFNGQLPKINSLVEKYNDEKLQVWIDELPRIFYDEMNGYDFDLDFFGTLLDFEDLKKVFYERVDKIEDGKVRLFHKNELGSVEQKETHLSVLLSWIQNHPNRRLNLNEFTNSYYQISNEEYPLLLVLGYYDQSSLENKYFKVEQVQKLQQLPENLFNLPIILFLDGSTMNLALKFIKLILSHNEFIPSQLFFIGSENVDMNAVCRTLQDVGVTSPQVVTSLSDVKLSRFIEQYPRVEVIQRHILHLKDIFLGIKEKLDIEVQDNEKTNLELYKKLNDLEKEIISLKNILDQFIERDNFEVPICFYDERDAVIQIINDWKKNRISISSDIEAEKVIQDFMIKLSLYFDNFLYQIEKKFDEFTINILENFQNIYDSSSYVDVFKVKPTIKFDFSQYQLSDISQNLKSCRKSQYVPKEDIIGWLNPFKSKEESIPTELIEKITYEYKDFKNIAVTDFISVANDIIASVSLELTTLYDKVAMEYIQHIEILIGDISRQREKMSLQLSTEQQLLQDDTEWLTEILDRLKVIERG